MIGLIIRLEQGGLNDLIELRVERGIMEYGCESDFARISLKKLIALAAVNPLFRQKLIEKRDRSLVDFRLRLSKIEEQTLIAMSDKALENLIQAVAAGAVEWEIRGN